MNPGLGGARRAGGHTEVKAGVGGRDGGDEQGGNVCALCTGLWGRLPPSFLQVMVALGTPAALQYSLTVRPSCTWVLSGLTWTLGPLPPCTWSTALATCCPALLWARHRYCP